MKKKKECVGPVSEKKKECVGHVSENVKKKKSVEDEQIYRKFLSWSRLQKRRTKLKCGRSFEH